EAALGAARDRKPDFALPAPHRLPPGSRRRRTFTSYLWGRGFRSTRLAGREPVVATHGREALRHGFADLAQVGIAMRRRQEAVASFPDDHAVVEQVIIEDLGVVGEVETEQGGEMDGPDRRTGGGELPVEPGAEVGGAGIEPFLQRGPLLLQMRQ